MASSKKFRSGNLRLDEWNGLWEAVPDDSPLANKESYEFYDQIASMCESYCASRRLAMSSIYPRGDYVDRSEYIELDRADYLTYELILSLKQWLEEHFSAKWRIIVSTYLGPEGAIIIYPKMICFPIRLNGIDVESALTVIRNEMKRIEE